jgi:glycosyltransferase involved in cell wall biosynthesis
VVQAVLDCSAVDATDPSSSQKPNEQHMKRAPKISVVIPAYNEATYIDRLLGCLAEQKFDDFEVIVSDAQSKDSTEKVVKSFSKKLNLSLVEAPPNGPAYGRNQGAKRAKGTWLLFLDADEVIKDPNFIEKLWYKTLDKGWKTSSAQMKVLPGSLLGKIGHSQGYLNLMSHTKHPIFQGYCMFTEKEVFDKLGGFNQKIKYGEDNDYATRSAKYGFGFVKKLYYYVDPRRYQQEGLKLLFKNSKHELYRLTHGFNFEKNTTTYEFGKHQRRGH